MSISNTLLPEFEHELAGTRKTLARVPEDKLTWKPHPKSMSMGRLATHLVELAGFAARVLESESLDFLPGGVPLPEWTLTSCAEILNTFDKSVAAGKTAIERTTDAEWMAPWTLLANGQVIFSLPRTAVMRNAVLDHIIHHRGQLTVYLRLNGVAVPGLYGPSADEAEAT
jgi:uncharacterized damage-inducible protein DinB